MQVSFIPGLARRGALRAQIETVRVSHDYRRKGLGASMVDWAIGESRRRGCAVVQLTTDSRDPTRTGSMSPSASSPRTRDSS
jgi:GNAT superfamily N-acetyltransferase